MSIRFDNVTKIYDSSKVPVIEGLNLEINNGSFMILLGPSGCGKTTLLRMLAGLEKVTKGSIFIDEKDVTNIEPGEREIAMVFQNYAIYPHMTVRGNIEFGLKNYKVSKEQINERIAAVLDRTGLTEYADRKPNQLSGGQRQRVALARAISKSPKVFLMDEPLSNLDAKLRTQMRSELIELYNAMGKTFVYVTHDQTEALTMGTDIAVIKKGVIMQHASPVDIYNNPNSVFVARFIGDPGMNVIRCSDDSYLGFKPRHISFKPTGGDEITIPGKVLTREYMGHDILYHILTAVGQIVVRSEDYLNNNDDVVLHINGEKLFFFDKDQKRTDKKSDAALVEVYQDDEE